MYITIMFMMHTQQINVFILFLIYVNTTKIQRNPESYGQIYKPSLPYYSSFNARNTKPSLTLNKKNKNFNLKELVSISKLFYQIMPSINFSICGDSNDKNNNYIMIRCDAKFATKLTLKKEDKKNKPLSINTNNIDADNFKIPQKNQQIYRETFKKNNYQKFIHSGKEILIYSRTGDYRNSLQEEENVFCLIPIHQDLSYELKTFNIANSGQINNIEGYNHCYIISVIDNILSQILLTIDDEEICIAKIAKLLTMTSTIGTIMNDDLAFKKFCKAIICDKSMSSFKWIDQESIQYCSQIIYEEITHQKYNNLFDNVRSISLFLLAIKSNMLKDSYAELNNTCIYKIFDTIYEKIIMEQTLYNTPEGKMENLFNLYNPEHLYITTTPHNGHYEAQISDSKACERNLKKTIADFYDTFSAKEFNAYKGNMNFFAEIYPKGFKIAARKIQESNKK